METVVCDIAKSHMKRDFNAALQHFGLFVKDIRFDESDGLSVVVEMSGDENVWMSAVVGLNSQKQAASF